MVAHSTRSATVIRRVASSANSCSPSGDEDSQYLCYSDRNTLTDCRLNLQIMPINETQLNGRIATLLDRMNARWSAYGETHGAFEGNQRQPDILVHQQGLRPVIIENEYLPANTVEPEAISRLGEDLDTDIVDTSGQINAVVALRSPHDLHDCRSHDQVDNLLSDGIQLEYALYTGTSRDEYNRFPQQGFIPGNLKDLAAFISYAAVPEDAIQTAIDTLIRGIGASATILREACEVSESTKEAITDILKQDYSDQTLRMAATIMINALVYQLSLSGRPGIPNYNDAMYLGSPIAPEFLRQWYKVLEINYWSIFKIAVDLLHGISSIEHANRALGVMVRTAERIHSLGVAESQDLIGTVFQGLIADRKYLATFYTRPESAALLAQLAIPDDDTWHDPERVKDFKVADHACGTGTLIHAAYRRINQLHLLSVGKPETLHAHMMQEALTACDVLPSAVHLTASMLSSSHPAERYDDTRTIVAQYGETDDGGVSIGSLDLLARNGEIRPLIPMHSGDVVTGVGDTQSADSVDMAPFNQDVVIMNPPFTRAGSDWEGDARASDYIKHFRGLGIDLQTQKKKSALKKRLVRKTCNDGRAGLATTFMALADHMVAKDGTVAMVLPMTALQGASWDKFRALIFRHYSDVVVVSIAAAKPRDQSFSADTDIGEILLMCRKTERHRNGRGTFISIRERPRNEMEATELANAIADLTNQPGLRSLEDGPYGGSPLLVGEEMWGGALNAPIGPEASWPLGGISDYSVSQTAFQLAAGYFWGPRMSEEEKIELPITIVKQICELGIYHMNIVGNGTQAAFHKPVSPPSPNPTYPMLWNHDADRELRMEVDPDSEGRVMQGKESRARAIWEARSHAHYRADFRFNSEQLGIAYTATQTIGGTSWPNAAFGDHGAEVAFTLWGNSTLGMLGYWWQASRQAAGRGRMAKSNFELTPTLDVTKLSEHQLQTAESIFEELKHLEFLPANEAYRDETRKLLDRRVLIDLLNLPESILEPLDLLRLKWCSEPSVHGGKGTAPDSS